MNKKYVNNAIKLVRNVLGQIIITVIHVKIKQALQFLEFALVFYH